MYIYIYTHIFIRVYKIKKCRISYFSQFIPEKCSETIKKISASDSRKFKTIEAQAKEYFLLI